MFAGSPTIFPSSRSSAVRERLTTAFGGLSFSGRSAFARSMAYIRGSRRPVARMKVPRSSSARAEVASAASRTEAATQRCEVMGAPPLAPSPTSGSVRISRGAASPPERRGCPEVSRRRGVEMHVVNACGRFAGEARPVEIGDVVHLRVEEVEDLEAQPRPGCEVVAPFQVQQHRGGGANAVVLDQRPRPEVAHEEAGAKWTELVEGGAGGGGPFDGAGDVVGSAAGEARVRPRQHDVEDQPAQRVPLAVPLDPVAPGRPGWLDGPGVADEDELRVHVQPPEGKRGLDVVQDLAAQAD